jgi:serine/threonine protein kinase
MGRVYLGTSNSRIRAAVKVMHSRLARDASFRERFRREADLAKRVSGRFTARILDSGVDDETPWLATEYISGPTLEQAVAEFGEFPEEEVLKLASQLARALRDIHSSQIIHRDLKPSNIICSPDGARVIDFGIARALDGRAVTSQLVGTIGYMSPENLRNRPVSEASDVFSLGCVLVYAATRRHPGRNAGSSNNSEEIDLRDVSYPLRGLIASCVQVNPDRRPTVDHLINEIADLSPAGGGNWAPSRSLPPDRTRQFPGRGTITAMQVAADRMRNEEWLTGIRPWCGRVVRSYRLNSAKLRTASLHWPLLGVASSRRWSRWCILLGSLSLVEVASRTAQVQSIWHGSLPWLRTALQVQSAIKQFTNWIPDPISNWAFSAGSASRTDDRLAIVTSTLLILMLIARRSHRNYIHQLVIKGLATYAGTVVMLLMGARLIQTGFGPLIHMAQYLRWWAPLSLLAAAAMIYFLSRAPGDKSLSS